jgi:HD superfamily phosphohydrolase
MIDRDIEIRCPIHGFIQLNEWEKRIIDHPVFQRLRRVRQLAWTDMVYPGAMHTRFEHSLGVMHVATLLYDSILKSSGDVLRDHFRYTDIGFQRDRQKVRLAALLHDVGHSPFSDAAETLFPERTAINVQEVLFPKHEITNVPAVINEKPKKSRCFEHEDYSAELIRGPLREVIDGDEFNKRNYGISSNDVAAILEGGIEAGPALFWRDLLTNQLDADRMDYLLRDSHHIGVSYGKYDLARLVATIVAYRDAEKDVPRIGISSGGWNAAESLIMARYSMFKQVYLHKTRIAFDIHIRGAIKSMLPGGVFPCPVEAGLKRYLEWDDWKVLGLLAAGEGGEHGERLRKRNQYRLVYRSKDFPKDLDELAAEDANLLKVKQALGGMVVQEERPKNKWYSSTADVDIPVISESDPDDIRPLSQYSHLLRDFVSQSPTFLFVKPEDAEKARLIAKGIAKAEAVEVVNDEPKSKPAMAERDSVKGGETNVGHSA